MAEPTNAADPAHARDAWRALPTPATFCRPIGALYAKLDAVRQACVLMVLGETSFSVMALLLKLTGKFMPALELVFFRSLAVWAMSLGPLLLPHLLVLASEVRHGLSRADSQGDGPSVVDGSVCVSSQLPLPVHRTHLRAPAGTPSDPKSVAPVLIHVAEADSRPFDPPVSSKQHVSTVGAMLASVLGPRHVWPVLFCKSLFGMASMSCMTYSLARLPLADATILSFTSPMFAAVLGRALLQEPFPLRNAALSLVSLIGVGFIARPSWLAQLAGPLLGLSAPQGAAPVSSSPPSAELLLGPVVVCLLGVFASAVSLVLTRRVGEQVSSMVMVQWHALVPLVLAPVLSLLTENLVAPPATWLLVQLPLIASFAFMKQYLQGRALQMARVGVVASMKYSQIVSSYLLQVLVFGQHLTASALIGCLLIAGSAALIRPPPPSPSSTESGLKLQLLTPAEECNEREESDDRTR